MGKMYRNGCAIGALALGALGGAPLAAAQTPPSSEAAATNDETGIADIVVTAQKREQRLSDVGITVAAFTGDDLARQGVNDVSQLTKIVPGLSYFTSTTATPVYSLRGVGFNESSLAAYPTTSIYVDEIPLPFPAMTSQAGLDAARVEVLKGPQGTLFGQNSTAGAINYVSASPTDSFEADGSLSYSRFNTIQFKGAMSGPLGETLKARLSVDAIRGDDWQKSYVRPGDTLGSVNRTAGRLILDWEPTERLTFKLNVTGWRDRSEPLAAQLVAATPADGVGYPAFNNYPRLPESNARLADWSPDWNIRANDGFWQAAVRGDYDLGGATLTSITSYADYSRDQRADQDGTALDVTNYTLEGRIKSFFQELRVANDGDGPFRWIVGANYSRDTVEDRDLFDFTDATGGRRFGFGLAGFFSEQKMRTYAGFGNIEYEVSDQVTLKAGARYTQANRSIDTCSFDTGDGKAAAVLTFIARLFNPAAPAIAPGACFTLNPTTFAGGLFSSTLKENNVSWRGGIDFKPSDNLLLYFNVAKGYKAGSFPTVQASFQTQYRPVTQESVLDFEGGFKYQTPDRKLSIEGAGFYYDYRDKQIRGKVIDPVFGPLEALQNIPKSHIGGVELAVSAAPADGLTFGLSGTWLTAKIDKFTGVSGSGAVADFAGAPIPYTPKWQLAANSDYEFPVSDNLNGFVGANALYHSKAYASIGTDLVPGFGENRDLHIKSYATLDLRAGVGAADESWKVTVWGRNITNNYHWDNVARLADVVVRYPAMPVTYGITLSLKHR